MYPSADKPYAGIFVRNQVEVMRHQFGEQWSITVRAMPRRFTGPLGTLLKYVIFTLRCVPLLFRKFDVVHVHYFTPLGIIGAVYRRLHRNSRLFVTFHGGDVNPRHFRGIRAGFWRRISKAIDCAVAVGPGVASAIESFLAPQRVLLLPAGIDSRRFYTPATETDDKSFDFVFAGSFSERKGVDLLLQALQDDRLAQASIVFVGTGPLRESIAAIAEQRPLRILDHLSQDELRQVFWDSRFIVLPSRSEPFGLVVSEAMYCGIPAIISDEPGLLSQVDEGRNGLVFPNGSIDALAQCLIRAMQLGETDYRQMARCASESNRGFDIFTVGEQLAIEYQKSVNDGL